MDQSSSNNSSSAAGNSSTNSAAQGGNPILDQAMDWVNNGGVSDVLNQVSPAIKKVSTQATTSFNKLSTTQKLVGGALILLGVGILTQRGRLTQATATDETSTLQELLLFVNDRIEGYQRAVDESKDSELRGYYKQLVSQSQQFANELNSALRELGGGRQTETTLKGKLYRRWMDAKAALTGRDEKAILGSNIYGEEWAIKAYNDAISQDTLTGDIRLAVERQYAQSQKTYERLKKLQADQQ